MFLVLRWTRNINVTVGILNKAILAMRCFYLANELVQHATKMSESAEKVEEQEGHIVDAEITEDVAEIDELEDLPEKSLS